MAYPIYLFFLAITPGLLWLFYFLKKDKHPEPKKMILKVFLLGMLWAPVAVLTEWLFQKTGWQNFLPENITNNPFFLFLQVLVGIALVEELVKYLVVKFAVMRHPEMDEPMDLLLYMIISALGFATIENIFIFLSPEMFSSGVQTSLALAVFRFVSATFLHALCSGIIGFFLALSFCEIKNQGLLFVAGFATSSLLHGLYNFSIMKLEGGMKLGIPLAVIAVSAIFIYFGIRYLKSIKSICKIR
jgi:protease PrsW